MVKNVNEIWKLTFIIFEYVAVAIEPTTQPANVTRTLGSEQNLLHTYTHILELVAKL